MRCLCLLRREASSMHNHIVKLGTFIKGACVQQKAILQTSRTLNSGPKSARTAYPCLSLGRISEMIASMPPSSTKQVYAAAMPFLISSPSGFRNARKSSRVLSNSCLSTASPSDSLCTKLRRLAALVLARLCRSKVESGAGDDEVDDALSSCAIARPAWFVCLQLENDKK